MPPPRSSEQRDRPGRPDRPGLETAAWAELLDALAELRREAGNPSLRDLISCGGYAAPALSTVSETLAGRRERISWEFVRFFVTACHRYVERREPDRALDGARLTDWHARWSWAAAESRRRPYHGTPMMPAVWNVVAHTRSSSAGTRCWTACGNGCTARRGCRC